MDYREVGRSGLRVSAVGLGCNNFGGAPIHAASGTVYGFMNLEATRAVVDAAFDSGVTLFDTADVYGQGGSERFLGEILRDRRHDVVIGTKWGSGLENQPEIAWGSSAYIRQAVEASLRRLGTDYIDIYQMHWPDSRTPIAETLAALDELISEGKVRHAGVSHFKPWQLADASWTARANGVRPFVCAQDHYSLLQRAAEAELIPACAHFGLGLMPYFPLENGLLTGKYRRDAPAPANARMAGRPIGAETYDLLERLDAFAAARGVAMLDVAIGAVASRETVCSVITGATRPDQIRGNAAAAAWKPTAGDRAELDSLLNPGTAAVAH